jgi:hypothetical protein
MASLKDPNMVQMRLSRVLAWRAERRDKPSVRSKGMMESGHGESKLGLALAKGQRQHLFVSHGTNAQSTIPWLGQSLVKYCGISTCAFSPDPQAQLAEGEKRLFRDIAESAVFALLLTEGTAGRYLVQLQLRVAFQMRKPFLLLVETDERHGKPDLSKERSAALLTGRDGMPLLRPQHLDWVFDRLPAIPLQREPHALRVTLHEIRNQTERALQGLHSKVQTPPQELTLLLGDGDADSGSSQRRGERLQAESLAVGASMVSHGTTNGSALDDVPSSSSSLSSSSSSSSPETWSVAELGAWLHGLQLSAVATAAADEAIDGATVRLCANTACNLSALVTANLHCVCVTGNGDRPARLA